MPVNKGFVKEKVAIEEENEKESGMYQERVIEALNRQPGIYAKEEAMRIQMVAEWITSDGY